MLQADENLKLRIYNEAIVLQSHDTIADLEEAKRKFLLLGDYKDSAKQAEFCATRINKLSQRKTRKTKLKALGKKVDIILLTLLIVAVIVGLYFGFTVLVEKYEERFSEISSKLASTPFRSETYVDDVKYTITFDFHNNGSGIHYIYESGITKEVKRFNWYLEVPLVGSPYVIVDFKDEEDDEIVFKLRVDYENYPKSLELIDDSFEWWYLIRTKKYQYK